MVLQYVLMKSLSNHKCRLGSVNTQSAPQLANLTFLPQTQRASSQASKLSKLTHTFCTSPLQQSSWCRPDESVYAITQNEFWSFSLTLYMWPWGVSFLWLYPIKIWILVKNHYFVLSDRPCTRYCCPALKCNIWRSLLSSQFPCNLMKWWKTSQFTDHNG